MSASRNVLRAPACRWSDQGRALRLGRGDLLDHPADGVLWCRRRVHSGGGLDARVRFVGEVLTGARADEGDTLEDDVGCDVVERAGLVLRPKRVGQLIIRMTRWSRMRGTG